MPAYPRTLSYASYFWDRGLGGLQTELWDVTSGENLKAYSHGYYSFEHAAFSPDGRYFALGYVSGYGTLIGYGSSQPMGNLVLVVDAKTGETVKKFSLPGQKRTYLQFSPSGRSLLAVTDEILAFLETEGWQSGGIPGITDVTMACFSDDESKVALLTRQNVCWLIRHDIQQFREEFVSEAKVTGLQLLGVDGARLVAAMGSNLNWRDMDKDGIYGSLAMKNPANILALGKSRVHGTVIAITEDGRAHSWDEDVERIELDASGEETAAVLRSATISKPGTSAIVEFIDGSVEFWDLSIAERRVISTVPSS
jgi:WD40 repeat protein